MSRGEAELGVVTHGWEMDTKHLEMPTWHGVEVIGEV